MATITTIPTKADPKAFNVDEVNRVLSRMGRREAISEIFVGSEERHYTALAENLLSDLPTRRRAIKLRMESK
jgi:hypothetical protein